MWHDNQRLSVYPMPTEQHVCCGRRGNTYLCVSCRHWGARLHCCSAGRCVHLWQWRLLHCKLWGVVFHSSFKVCLKSFVCGDAEQFQSLSDLVYSASLPTDLCDVCSGTLLMNLSTIKCCLIWHSGSRPIK